METLPDQPSLRDIRDHINYWLGKKIAFDVVVRNWIEAEKGQLKLEVKFTAVSAQQYAKPVGDFVYEYRDTIINLMIFGMDDASLSRLEFSKSLYESGAITDSLTRRRRKTAKDAVTVCR